MNGARAALIAVLLCIPSALSAQAGAAQWRRLDVNRDGAFDGKDVKAITSTGMQAPTIDVNQDGAKDLQDAWALARDLTSWDYNADGRVTPADFVTFPSVSLPAPDQKAAEAVAARALAGVNGKIKQSVRDSVARMFKPHDVTHPDTLVSMWLEIGMAALLSLNMDGATWAYGNAVQAKPGSPEALAALGFALIENNNLRDAAIVLVRALQIAPHVCVINTNMGQLLARYGRPDQAEPYFRKATTNCPGVAQFHANLAAILMRRSMNANALIEFERAEKLNPGDPENSIMVMSLKPAPPNVSARFESEYEKLRTTDDGWKDRDAWRTLGNESRIYAILELVTLPSGREFVRTVDQLRQESGERREKVARRALPDGKDMCADLKKWMGNWGSVIEELREIDEVEQQAERDAASAAVRKAAAAQLAVSKVIHQLALIEATAVLPKEGRSSFDNYMNNLYETPMREAMHRLQTGAGSPSLEPDSDEDDKLEEAVTLSFMAITAGSLDKTYGGEAKCAGNGQIDAAAASLQKDFSVGLNVGIVGFEVVPRTCELKLQVGQGIFAAGTYQPHSGFGSQLGLGFQGKFGVVDMQASTYLKLGSDGSLSENVGVEFAAGPHGAFGKYGITGETGLVPAENPPVGSSKYIADLFGCDKP